MLPGAFDLKKMRPLGVYQSLIKGQDEKILRLKHSVKSEIESSIRDLLGRVLVTIRQAGQAPDAHHNHTVTSVHGHARRSLRDLNMDVEAGVHGGDRRSVAGVETRGELAILSHSADSIHVKNLAGDGAVTGEHGISQGKTKVCSHIYHSFQIIDPKIGLRSPLPFFFLRDEVNAETLKPSIKTLRHLSHLVEARLSKSTHYKCLSSLRLTRSNLCAYSKTFSAQCKSR